MTIINPRWERQADRDGTEIEQTETDGVSVDDNTYRR